MAQSLADSISDAESHATVLDDRAVLEDRAVYRWLHAHELPGRHHHLVIGDETLPRAWRERTLKFIDAADGDRFLRRLKPEHAAMIALRRLAAGLATTPPAAETEQVFFHRLGAALHSGRIWAIEARRAPNPHVGKTDPRVFDALNPRFGAKIDFQMIARLEGDQWRRGYVPISKTNMVLGRSGLTIATGFDVGQWSADQLDAMGLPSALTAKLKPFCNHNFKGMSRADVVKAVAKLGPVPEITKAEADLLDGVVFANILQSAIADWDRLRSPGAPNFTAMPASWQTVWLSRNFQEGRTAKSAPAKAFRVAALAGAWAEAIAALRRYTEYQDRANAEAARLAAQMPAPLPASGVAPGLRPSPFPNPMPGRLP